MATPVHGAETVVGAYLLAQAAVAVPAANAVWPYFVNQYPPTPAALVAIYGTAGRMDGRIMRDGVTVDHPGILVAVRADTEAVARAKIAAIADLLDACQRELVTVGAVQYRIDAITRTGTIIPLGPEEGQPNRRRFTLNAIVTLGVHA